MTKAQAKQTPSDAALANQLGTSLLYFTAEIESSLSSGKQVDPSDLAHYTSKAKDADVPTGGLSRDTSYRMESAARRIWNVCLRKQNLITPKVGSNINLALSQYYLHVRLLAYLLLCLAATGTGGARDADRIDSSYLIRLGLALSKVCINAADIESARIALQKVTECLERDTRETTTVAAAQTQTSRHAEYTSYYILRIALSWKDDRLDLAEHMYTKATHYISFLNGEPANSVTTTLVQLLTQVGQSLMETASNYTAALSWFRRAVSESARLSSDMGSQNGAAAATDAQQQQHKRSRIAATRGMLKCLTEMGSFDEARQIVAAVQGEFGPQSLGVLEMAATVYLAVGDFVSLGTTLTDMVHKWNETGESQSTATLEFVLLGVERMGQLDGERATWVLDHLLSFQVHRPGSVLDKAVVLRAQLLLHENDAEVIWDLFELLDCVRSNADALGTDAAQQLQQLLWAIIQPLYHDKKYAQVLSWCRLGLHAALSSTDTTNHAKFLRKMLACHIELASYTEALAVFQTLPQAAQDHVIARFLLFRLAIRGWNLTLAGECLRFFATQTDRNEARDALYACIREAQSSGDKVCTADALEAVAVTWKGEDCVSRNVPSVLRCAIRLQQLILTETGPDFTNDKGIEDRFRVAMVHLFQMAEIVSRDVHDETGAMVFNAPELQWFYTNAYNLGVVYCTSWNPGCVVSLFKSCLAFLQAFPLSSPEATAAPSDTAEADVVLASLRCHFVLASLYISEAQANESGEHTASLYVDAEHHATAFASRFEQTIATTLPASCCPDLLQKYGILCIFHLEALLFQQAWESILPIIDQARLCKDGNVFKALGDCVIASAAPPQVKSSILKRIVNEIFHLERFNSERLAQYLCCMVHVLLLPAPAFTVASSTPCTDDNLVLDILDQAIQLATEAKEAGVPFPADEAAWLATTAFNHGLVRYAARGSISICHAWLDRAIAMARYADADGALSAALQERQRTVADAFAHEVTISTAQAPTHDQSTSSISKELYIHNHSLDQ